MATVYDMVRNEFIQDSYTEESDQPMTQQPAEFEQLQLQLVSQTDSTKEKVFPADLINSSMTNFVDSMK